MFSFFLNANSLSAGEEYKKDIIFSIPTDKYEKEIPTDFVGDEDGNLYFLYQSDQELKVFDKTGQQVRVIKFKKNSDTANYQLKIGDDGNLLVVSREDFIIYEKNGKFVSRGKLPGCPALEGIRLFDGNIFSDDDGRIYIKNASNQRLMTKNGYSRNFKPYRDNKSKTAIEIRKNSSEQTGIPYKQGNYVFDSVVATDYQGNFYVSYLIPPNKPWDHLHPYQFKYKTLKYDKDFSLKASFDFEIKNNEINEHTEDIFSIAEEEYGKVNFIIWRKNTVN